MLIMVAWMRIIGRTLTCVSINNMNQVDDQVEACEEPEGDAGDEDTGEGAALLKGPVLAVTRPRAPFGVLMYHLLDSMTGLLSVMRINTNRDPSPLDLALLRARYSRPPIDEVYLDMKVFWLRTLR